MNKRKLLNALKKLWDEYDAFYMLNRYSWQYHENTHATEFEFLSKLKGDKVHNALRWIHDCYDCDYKHQLEASEDNPFKYLYNIIKNYKQIYAFDFDGTIVTNKFPEIGDPIKDTIYFIKQVQNDGDYIILNTMRENDSLEKAVAFCKELGIEFDAVNDNLPHMKEFYGNNPRKIFANYYIDDHNLFLEGVNHYDY